ncbi:hypothetical protein GEMRC1_001047 [Eukaryota sp. GEM-RC1]
MPVTTRSKTRATSSSAPVPPTNFSKRKVSPTQPPLKTSRPSNDSPASPLMTCQDVSSLLLDTSSKHFYFQQSLLTSLKVFFADHRFYRRFSDLFHYLLSFFRKVGYVSNRFLESSSLAVKVLLERNTCLVLIHELRLLSYVASIFEAKVHSVCVKVDNRTLVKDIGEYTSVVTRLKSDDCCHLHHFLDPSSSDFLSCLRVLEVTNKPSDNLFNSFCKSLMVNYTVVELNIEFGSLTSTEAASLAELFSSNNTLQTICLKTKNRFQLQEAESLTIFIAISNNLVISKIDLTYLQIQSSNGLLPLLNSSSLKVLFSP